MIFYVWAQFGFNHAKALLEAMPIELSISYTRERSEQSYFLPSVNIDFNWQISKTGIVIKHGFN